MKDYKLNVKDYLEDFWLVEETCKAGDDFGFFPDDDVISFQNTLQSITKNATDYTFTLAIKNYETGQVYTKSYNVQKGSRIDMIMLMPNVACGMPPGRTEVLMEITNISEEALSLKVVGVVD